MKTPRISVLTAARNALPFLNEAIESIRAQSFVDFEYLLVDDASEDETWATICQQAECDSRIKAIRNPIRLGAAEALNVALRQARGEYVAILDADDLALPERLERQVGFLDRHPDYAAIGSAVRFIDALGSKLRDSSYPTHPASARWNLLFGASLLHSSLYRRELLLRTGGYSPQHGYLCDYELLCRLVEHGKIGNLGEVLSCYRQHQQQTSVVHRTLQTGQMLLLQFALQRRWLGLSSNLATFRTLRNWTYGQAPHDHGSAVAAIEELQKLHQNYLERTPQLSMNDRSAINQSCALRWAIMAHATYQHYPAIARECWRKVRVVDPELKSGIEIRRLLRQRSNSG